MKCDRDTLLLYAVTDRAWTGKQSLAEQVEAAIKGGVTCVQLREKELDKADFFAEALEIAALCGKYKIPLFINDNVELAKLCGAEGVHVGQDDMPAAEARRILGESAIIGVSVQSVDQALEAVSQGADYLGVGAMFSTSTKADADVLSMEALREICAAVDLPVVAIGGIGRSNMLELSGSGIAGVALVSAIFSAGDIESECRELLRLVKEVRGHGT